MKIWWGEAGEIAEGKVDDASAVVTEAWTGPQVAWKMGRGYKGAFGRELINNPWLWGAFCVVFLLGLADLRRPVSLRNLDLLMLLSPSASLWYFNHGDVFTAVPLFYPALIWVVLRGVWIGATGRGSRARPVWPVGVLLMATVFLAGFRIGMNVRESNVIDVGYSGVIGAERIVHGQAPWGNFPIEGEPEGVRAGRCGGRDPRAHPGERTLREREPAGRHVRPGRVRVLHPRLPALRLEREVGLAAGGALHLDRLRSPLRARARSSSDGASAACSSRRCSRSPGSRIRSRSTRRTPTRTTPSCRASSSGGSGSPRRRSAAASSARSRGLTKFASFVVAPLWLTYPGRRPSRRFVLGFLLATAAAFSVVLLEPRPLHELRVFWDRTVRWQVGRDAPWSLWDWRQYHARGIPDLHVVQRVLQGLLLVGALAAAFVPRRKSPLQLAALTAALLAGFELVLTYWLYTYIPWFFGFAAIALLAPAAVAASALQLDAEQLDPGRPAVVGAVDDDALDPDAAVGGLEANR